MKIVNKINGVKLSSLSGGDVIKWDRLTLIVTDGLADNGLVRVVNPDDGFIYYLSPNNYVQHMKDAELHI